MDDMDGWISTRLEDVCQRVTVGFVGSMAHEYCEGGIPFLRSQNIRPFRLDLADIKFIPRAFHERISKSMLRPGDVAVVRTGYPGTSCVIPPSLPESNCSDLVIVRPAKGLNPHFLAAIFNSAFGKELVGGNLVGAAQQHFNVTVAKQLKLLLPPRKTQDKIAAILTTYDDLIANNQRRIARLESMAEEIYREWFVRMRFPGGGRAQSLRALPLGWREGAVDDILRERKRQVKRDELGAHARYIGLEHLPRRALTIAAWGSPDDVGSDKLSFNLGDILFGKIRPYLHKVAIARFAGICSTDTIVLAPRCDSLRYFALFLVFSDAFVDLANTASKGTKMPRAEWSFLKRQTIRIPPQNVLDRFNDNVRPLLELASQLAGQSERLLQQRDTLLPRLISGKLRVDDLDIQFPSSMQDEAA
jgi:type I restriction enzyme, S subunit